MTLSRTRTRLVLACIALGGILAASTDWNLT